tara:strand:- start:5445 stop:5702 length:258 start_codon:yes stop_codon:yes gene_type:complete
VFWNQYKIGATFGATSGFIQAGYQYSQGNVSESEALTLFGASIGAGALTFGAAKGLFPSYGVLFGAGVSAGEAAVYIYLPDGGSN